METVVPSMSFTERPRHFQLAGLARSNCLPTAAPKCSIKPNGSRCLALQ